MGYSNTFLQVVKEISESKADDIREYLNSSEKELFEAVLGNLFDFNNPLRLNNFAYSARELIRIFLDNRTNEHEIKDCIWYDSKRSNNKVTRSDKISFLIHKFLPKEYVMNTLSIDLNSIINELISSIDTLSKYTHISGTFKEDSENEQIARLLFDAFGNFLNIINITNEKVSDDLIDNISHIVNEGFMVEYHSTVESLSTHTAISNVGIDEYNIVSIDKNKIIVKVIGMLELELQWGSNSDVRCGNGLVGNTETPYSLNIIVPFDYDDLENPFDKIFIDENSISVEGYDKLTAIVS